MFFFFLLFKPARFAFPELPLARAAPRNSAASAEPACPTGILSSIHSASSGERRATTPHRQPLRPCYVFPLFEKLLFQFQCLPRSCFPLFIFSFTPRRTYTARALLSADVGWLCRNIFKRPRAAFLPTRWKHENRANTQIFPK